MYISWNYDTREDFAENIRTKPQQTVTLVPNESHAKHNMNFHRGKFSYGDLSGLKTEKFPLRKISQVALPKQWGGKYLLAKNHFSQFSRIVIVVEAKKSSRSVYRVGKFIASGILRNEWSSILQKSCVTEEQLWLASEAYDKCESGTTRTVRASCRGAGKTLDNRALLHIKSQLFLSSLGERRKSRWELWP